MTAISLETARGMSDEQIHALIAGLESEWKSLDRKSDPRGEYTRRQDNISDELEILRSVKAERASSD